MDGISDLYTVELAEGLPVSINGKIVFYKRVLLREATYQHQQNAIRAVQELRRCADDGVYRLVHNQELLESARIVQQIDRFTGAGEPILSDSIDLATIGKLHPFDVLLITHRMLHIEWAAQLRWKLITQSDYEILLQGESLLRGTPPSPEDVVITLKRAIDVISRITHTAIDVLSDMTLAELQATLQNLADSR